MKGKRNIRALALSVLVLLLTGCGGNEADTGAEVPAARLVEAEEAGGQSDGQEEPQEAKEQTVTANGTAGNLTVEIPEGWDFQICPETEEEYSTWFGAEFWPGEAPEARVAVKYVIGLLCICGTGVTREDIVFSDGRGGTLYTEEINGSVWLTFFFDSDIQGSTLVADGEIPAEQWAQYREQILEILGSVRFFSADHTDSNA